MGGFIETKNKRRQKERGQKRMKVIIKKIRQKKRQTDRKKIIAS